MEYNHICIYNIHGAIVSKLACDMAVFVPILSYFLPIVLFLKLMLEEKVHTPTTRDFNNFLPGLRDHWNNNTSRRVILILKFTF